jgi:hypothetical protein
MALKTGGVVAVVSIAMGTLHTKLKTNNSQSPLLICIDLPPSLNDNIS